MTLSCMHWFATQADVCCRCAVLLYQMRREPWSLQRLWRGFMDSDDTTSAEAMATALFLTEEPPHEEVHKWRAELLIWQLRRTKLFETFRRRIDILHGHLSTSQLVQACKILQAHALGFGTGRRQFAASTLGAVAAVLPEPQWRQALESLRGLAKDTDHRVRNAAASAMGAFAAQLSEPRGWQVRELLQGPAEELSLHNHDFISRAASALAVSLSKSQQRQIITLVSAFAQHTAWGARCFAANVVAALAARLSALQRQEAFDLLQDLAQDHD